MIRPADRRSDNAALCALARQCPQGRRLRFYHERSDYWERGRLQPQLDVLVVEEHGELTAAVSVARKQLWIGGVREPVAYLHDLMVRPDRRGRGLGRHLIRAARSASPEARLFYCCIVEDNDASRLLFEAEGFLPHPRRLLYHALVPSLAQLRPPRAWSLDASPAAVEAVQEWVRRHRDFVDETRSHDRLFVVRRNSGAAWGALRRQDAQVFVQLPWALTLAGRLFPFLPTLGRPVRAWTLHHLGREGQDGNASLRRLLRGVAWDAVAARVDAVVVPLFENDPLTAEVRAATLTGWGLAPGVARLYVAGERVGAVLGAARPLILNGQDA